MLTMFQVSREFGRQQYALRSALATVARPDSAPSVRQVDIKDVDCLARGQYTYHLHRYRACVGVCRLGEALVFAELSARVRLLNAMMS